MAGLEVLGVIASALQVADIGLKILNSLLEIMDRFKGYNEQLNSHIIQVRQLTEAANLISETPGLQTPAIHSHLQSTLVEAAGLNLTLEKLAAKSSTSAGRRYWEIAVKGGFREREILERLGGLEQRKTALILCITVAHSETLAGIHSRVSFLVGIVEQEMGCGVSSAVCCGLQ